MSKTKNKKEKVICDKCGIKYDFPSKVSVINCACGAQVFKPAKKKSTKPVAKKGKKK